MALQVVRDDPPYRFRPTESVVQIFLEHVRRTAQPETSPTINRSKPRADSRPIYLRRFDVDRAKRPNGDMAPCPICSPNDPKFLNGGYLVWYPDEGVIRAIGPECGDTVFGGDQYAKALVQFNLDERQRRAEDFLERNLVKVLAMHAALEAIRPAAIEAERLYQELRAKMRKTGAELQRIERNDFVLSLSIYREIPEAELEVYDDDDGSGVFEEDGTKYVIDNVTFGRLPDSTILYPKFQPVKDHNEIAQLLCTLPKLMSTQEAFLWICDHERLDHLEQAGQIMRRASRLYVRLADRLDRFNAFFSRSVFAQLNAWGQHPQNSFDLAAEFANGEFTLRHGRGRARREREEVTLRPNFDALHARGEWPGFE
jgi:hypothetical protein